MHIRRAALFAAAVFAAAALSAQQVTKKFDYKPVDGIQTISLAIDKVKINQIVFKTGRAAGGPLRRSDAAYRRENGRMVAHPSYIFLISGQSS